ncbi:hypothetical protein QOT17_000687 [Balamuthia mandrillaris]
MEPCELEVIQSLLLQQEEEPSPIKRVALAPPDNSMVVCYIKVLFLYKRLDPLLLLPALRNTLSHYPIFFGRLERSLCNGRWTALLNNAGVRFVHARTNATILSSFNSLSSTENLLNANVIPCNLFCDEGLDLFSSESPVLAVQVTEFQDGAVAVAVCAHHIVGDGPALFRFIHQWSDNAAALLHQPSAKQVAVSVCHERELLRPCWTTPRLEHPEYSLKTQTLLEKVQRSPPTSVKSFHFRRDDLARLKAAASTSCNAGEFVSTNDALTSLFFQVITSARKIENKDTTVKLGYAVDGRPRLPFLPEEYCGNVTFFGLVRTDVTQLLAMSLGECSKLIRKTTDSMTAEYLQDALAWIEAQEDTSLIDVRRSGNDIAVSSWVRAQLYDATFGQGQQPFYAGLPPLDVPDGQLFFVDAPEGDGVLAVLWLQQDHMETIEHDSYFRSFCPLHHS